MNDVQKQTYEILVHTLCKENSKQLFFVAYYNDKYVNQETIIFYETIKEIYSCLIDCNATS